MAGATKPSALIIELTGFIGIKFLPCLLQGDGRIGGECLFTYVLALTIVNGICDPRLSWHDTPL